MHIIIEDEDICIRMEIEKKYLKYIPYFKSLMKFESIEIPIIEVKNAIIMRDVILRRKEYIKYLEARVWGVLHFDALNELDGGVVIEENPVHWHNWSYQLETIRYQDFLGLEASFVSDLKVPAEGFELLLEIAHLIGFSDNVKVINDNLPMEYPLENISQELIKMMYMAASQYYVISSSNDNTIRYWDIKTGYSDTLVKHHFIESNSTYHYINKYLVPINSPIRVKILNCIKKELKVDYISERIIEYSPDNSFIAIVCHNNTIIKIFNAGGCLISEIKTDDHILSMAFSYDNQHFACSSFSPEIKIFDVKTGKLIKTLSQHSPTTIYSVIYTPDNKYIVSGDLHARINIWDRQNGFYIKNLRGHTQTINSLIILSIENDLTNRLNKYL